MWEKASRQRGHKDKDRRQGVQLLSLSHSREATVAGAEAAMGEGGQRDT